MKNPEGLNQFQFTEITLENANLLTDLRLKINNDKPIEVLKTESVEYANDPNRKAFISVEGDILTGFVQLMVESNDLRADAPKVDIQNLAHLVRIAVVEEHRKKGIGKALLLQAEQWAIDHGKKGIWLSYLAMNDEARKLYLKAGYKDAAEFIDTKKGKLRRITIKLFE